MKYLSLSVIATLLLVACQPLESSVITIQIPDTSTGDSQQSQGDTSANTGSPDTDSETDSGTQDPTTGADPETGSNTETESDSNTGETDSDIDNTGDREDNSTNTDPETDPNTGIDTDAKAGNNTDTSNSATDETANIDPTTIFSNGVHQVTAGTLLAQEAELTSFSSMQAVKNSIRTLPNDQVEAIQPGNSNNPANVQRLERLLTEADWEYLFPHRAPEYTYRGMLQAVGKFPAFCGEYAEGRDADQICRKSLATMFAHFAQETGGHNRHDAIPEWRQALVHVREMGWDETMPGGYNGECAPNTWQGQTWPCGTLDSGEYKSYFGRGAKQLSYNYNYGPFSEAIFGDVRVLLNAPELVADTWLNLASAVFFYLYPQPPKPSMLHVIDGTWQPNANDLANGLVSGFGVTTQIINGGVECGGSSEHIQSQNRIDYYREFAAFFGVAISGDEVLGCQGMKQFDAAGAGALPIYWEQDWSWSANTPDGQSYQCQLVNYQTPFSAFKPGDYINCVSDFFGLQPI